MPVKTKPEVGTLWVHLRTGSIVMIESIPQYEDRDFVCYHVIFELCTTYHLIERIGVYEMDGPKHLASYTHIFAGDLAPMFRPLSILELGRFWANIQSAVNTYLEKISL